MANDESIKLPKNDLLETANRTGQKGMTALGQKLDDAASFLEQRVGEAVEQGKVPVVNREHVSAVTGGLHDAARYLQERDPRSLMADLDDAIQRHPYRAMAVGLGIGWLIGRLTRRD